MQGLAVETSTTSKKKCCWTNDYWIAKENQ